MLHTCNIAEKHRLMSLYQTCQNTFRLTTPDLSVPGEHCELYSEWPCMDTVRGKHQVHQSVFKPDSCEPVTFRIDPCIVAAAKNKKVVSAEASTVLTAPTFPPTHSRLSSVMYQQPEMSMVKSKINNKVSSLDIERLEICFFSNNDKQMHNDETKAALF